MFALWHRIRDGTLSRPDFQSAVQPIQAQVHALLQEGTTLAQPKTASTCANLLKLEPALWTFVALEGVEPTNNDAERPLRRAVLWRRRSFGTQSASGSQFVARILTTVTTLQMQHRNVLDYLTAACEAQIRGTEAPSLLPGQAALATATTMAFANATGLTVELAYYPPYHSKYNRASAAGPCSKSTGTVACRLPCRPWSSAPRP